MKSRRPSRNSRHAVVVQLHFEVDDKETDEEQQLFPVSTPDAYHPDLPFTLLQRIKRNEIISLDLQNKHSFKGDGCRILACSLPLNTSITSLDLWGTNIGAGASFLIPTLGHLNALTFLRLSVTNLQSRDLHQLCSALLYLTAMTELMLVGHDAGNCPIQNLDDDDGARICGAVAAAGMTRLEKLELGWHIHPFSVVHSEEWNVKLGLPQPPDDFFFPDFTGLVHFLMSNDKDAFLETYHPEYQPDLPLRLLKRIERSDPTLTELRMKQKTNFDHGWRILARSLALNTCITHLDLHGTDIDPGALFPAIAHLTAMTEINLSWSSMFSGVKLCADDVARICCAAAAAGMTRLKKLDLSGHDEMNPYLFSSCETWTQLDLPQPPCEIVPNVKKCRFGGWTISDYAPIVSYLSNEDEDALIRALLFEVQGQFSPALELHGSRLLQRKSTLGGDHPRTKETQFWRDMCVSSVLGYRSALSMSKLMAAELQLLHAQVGALPVSQCFRTHDVSMPLKERWRAQCGGGVGLLVSRMAIAGRVADRTQERDAKRIIKIILMHVSAMNAYNRSM